MHKAGHLSKKLEQMTVPDGMKEIEKSQKRAIYFDVIGDTMCIMHDDGSVNMIESAGGGVITGEVVSAENILKVLHHYRPFREVFGGSFQ